MLEGDGGGAPEVSLEGQTRWYRTGTSGNWGRLRQKTGLLVLFGVRRQGYSTYEMRADGLPIWGMSANGTGHRAFVACLSNPTRSATRLPKQVSPSE
jgi:hypothetical protein